MYECNEKYQDIVYSIQRLNGFIRKFINEQYFSDLKFFSLLKNRKRTPTSLFIIQSVEKCGAKCDKTNNLFLFSQSPRRPEKLLISTSFQEIYRSMTLAKNHFRLSRKKMCFLFHYLKVNFVEIFKNAETNTDRHGVIC